MIEPGSLLISVKPEYADSIVQGEKSIELRRRRPRAQFPIRAFVYATAPLKAILGTCVIYGSFSGELEHVWKKAQNRARVSRTAFDDYFEGADSGEALLIKDEVRFENPICLEDIRRLVDESVPPRSFRYLTEKQTQMLLAQSGL
jgi:predicted transcriptional regulator